MVPNLYSLTLGGDKKPAHLRTDADFLRVTHLRNLVLERIADLNVLQERIASQNPLSVTIESCTVPLLASGLFNSDEVEAVSLRSSVILSIADDAFGAPNTSQTISVQYSSLPWITPEQFRSGARITSFVLSASDLEGIAIDTFVKVPIENFMCVQTRGLTQIPDFGSRIAKIEIVGCGPLDLQPRIFASNSSLTDLILVDSQLVDLPPQLLEGLTQLRLLDLSLNWISSIPAIFCGTHLYWSISL